MDLDMPPASWEAPDSEAQADKTMRTRSSGKYFPFIGYLADLA